MSKINMKNLKEAVKFSVKKTPVIVAGTLVLGEVAEKLFDNHIITAATMGLGMFILSKDAVDEYAKVDDLEFKIEELQARIAELENRE